MTSIPAEFEDTNDQETDESRQAPTPFASTAATSCCPSQAAEHAAERRPPRLGILLPGARGAAIACMISTLGVPSTALFSVLVDEKLERVVRLPEASHWVQHDEPNRVAELLGEFFAGATERGDLAT